MITWEEYWKTENRFACKRSGQGVPMESLVPGRYRQLFVDNYVIEHSDNLTKQLHQPCRDPHNPLIRPDRPWEDMISHVNVIYDDEEHCFKAWYGTAAGTAYALSKDGIDWEKPLLGMVEHDGNKENNLVTGPITSGTFLKDPTEPDRARRYKYFAMKSHPRYGLYIGFSSDGLNWTGRAEPVLTTDDDPGLNDHPTMMHDRVRGGYIAFTKREMNNPLANGDWGMIQRMRCVSTSDDFETWTAPVLTLRADDCDPPYFQVHGLSGFNYENVYLGFIDAMHSGDVGPMERTINLQLALSRDGQVWWRAGNRQTFLPLGARAAFDAFMILPAHTPPIRVGEELYIYYSGMARRHRRGKYPHHRRREPWCGPGHTEYGEEGISEQSFPPPDPDQPTSGMGLARLRIDGFVSVDAGPRPGRLLTRPLRFRGRRLHINADARGGIVKAELYQALPVDLAANNWTNSPAWNWAIKHPIPGYSLGECTGVSGDTTDGVLQWRNGDTIEPLSDQMIVVRFQLSKASLYSFWLE